MFDFLRLTQPSANSTRTPSISLRDVSASPFALRAARARAIAASLSSTLKLISPELAYTPDMGFIICENVFPPRFAFATSPSTLSAARTPESQQWNSRK